MEGVPAANPWLTTLHPPVQPEPPAFWPPAPGWLVLAALLVVAIVYVSWRGWRRWRANSYRRTALAELAHLRSLSQQPSTLVEVQRSLPRLLRQVALDSCERLKPPEQAGVNPRMLVGQDWWAWLDQRWDKDLFSRGAGAALHRLAYAPDDQLMSVQTEALTDLFEVVDAWVRCHRRAGENRC